MSDLEELGMKSNIMLLRIYAFIVFRCMGMIERRLFVLQEVTQWRSQDTEVARARGLHTAEGSA